MFLDIARRHGVNVLERSIFDHVPGAGRWRTALLLDGNIGIGGDPVALLERLGDLLGTSTAASSSRSSRTTSPIGSSLVRAETAHDRQGRGSDGRPLARRACSPSLTPSVCDVVDTWDADERCFVRLERS